MSCGRSVVFSVYSCFLTNKTDHKDITELLLKVELNIITLPPFHKGHIILIPTRPILIPTLLWYVLVEKEPTHVCNLWFGQTGIHTHYPTTHSILSHAHPVKKDFTRQTHSTNENTFRYYWVFITYLIITITPLIK